MPYQCFFSYARKNRSDDLNRFVADLREKILLRKYLPEDEVVFFDGEGIEAGALWKQELSEALRTSRVFLAICSPDYINSVQPAIPVLTDLASRYDASQGRKDMWQAIKIAWMGGG
jgi:hypothetical protein